MEARLPVIRNEDAKSITFDANGDIWLKVRLDGQEGWIHTEEDFEASRVAAIRITVGSLPAKTIRLAKVDKKLGLSLTVHLTTHSLLAGKQQPIISPCPQRICMPSL